MVCPRTRSISLVTGYRRSRSVICTATPPTSPRCSAGFDEEVVLVGHSYGGAVVTQATGSAHAVADRVAHLVYLTAFALDDGESVWGFSRSRPRVRVALDAAVIGGDDGTSRIDPDKARPALYAMCPPAEVSAAVARLDAQPIASFQQPVAGSPRATIASTYVKCTADEAVHIDLQDELAGRCDHILTFESDHSPFLAMPGGGRRRPRAADPTVSPTMKVRIGYGLGVRTKLHDATFGLVVDELERLRFDSLWLSERIGGEAPDPLVAMSFAAGRTETLKFGMSVMVLPGRNPIVLAKELATLAVMSGGRLLPAFGLGVADPHEQQAFGVERGARAKLFDESLAVMRACWTGEPVVHHGDRFHYDGVRVLAGAGPPRRLVGRLRAVGAAPRRTPRRRVAAVVHHAGRRRRGTQTIEQVCAEHDRSIDDDHYGVLIPYSFEPVPEQVLARFRDRRPDLEDPSVLVPGSWERLVSLIREFVDVGCTKFVVIPLAEPADAGAWAAHLGEAAEALLPLER